MFLIAICQVVQMVLVLLVMDNGMNITANSERGVLLVKYLCRCIVCIHVSTCSLHLLLAMLCVYCRLNVCNDETTSLHQYYLFTSYFLVLQFAHVACDIFTYCLNPTLSPPFGRLAALTDLTRSEAHILPYESSMY